jgi:hypothetical protein
MTQAIRDRIQRWVSLPHPPEKVWAEIGGFGDMAAWHPGIESAEVFDIEGEIHRHLTLGDGGLILERLVETGPEEGGCHVFWSAMFEPTDPSADEIVSGFYEEGLRALRERYGG